MADAKDILGLPKGPLPTQERRPKPSKDVAKKPDGVSREVYALTGGLPLLMPSVDIKKRPASGADKISWQWLPFTSSARKDNLELFHWVKVVNGVPPTGDYTFAKYNKKVDVIRYTDEEYAKYLADPNWTREETDQLFDLCERFDLRFIIIADRFSPPRSVEDLKNRYYSAARAILLAKAPSPEEVADHPLVKEPYNIIPEVERKKTLSTVYSQSKQQEHEEAEVLTEAKRITEERLSAKSVEEAEVSVAVPDTAVLNVEAEKVSTPVGSTSPSPAPTQVPIVPASTLTSNFTGQPSAGQPTAASIRTPRIYLRSTVLAQMVQAQLSSSGVRTVKRVDQTLQDLGVNVKPRVPTKTVCTEHLELRKEILTLINFQKQVQIKEAEISALRDNSYAEFPSTPSTPKLQRSNRGFDHEKMPMRGYFGADDFTGERIMRRDHKRKAPGRFGEAPPSPPQNKRARKKNSDS